MLGSARSYFPCNKHSYHLYHQKKDNVIERLEFLQTVRAELINYLISCLVLERLAVLYLISVRTYLSQCLNKFTCIQKEIYKNQPRPTNLRYVLNEK